MEKWTVRCVEVTKAPDRPRPKTFRERLFGVKVGPSKDPEKEHDRKPPIGPAVVTAKANGPLAWVTLASCFLSIAMFMVSIICGDGYSLVATLLLSFLSTLIGVVNKSTLSLPQRPRGANENDIKHVVIRYPKGSFLVVKCDENVARELYFAPEEIDYQLKSAPAYRLISLVGTILLMGGVIFLANARLQLQFAWAGAYIITNILHWVAAAVPARLHWDLSCYIVREHGIVGGPKSDSFTEALWKAIVFTKQTEWIKNGSAAPSSEVWDRWLEDMEERAHSLGWHTEPTYDTNKDWQEDDQPAQYGQSYTIWDVPADFDAKGEWDNLNREFLKKKASSKAASVEHSEA